MDHAEAQERIANLALEPRRLVEPGVEPEPEARALIVHAQGCPACRADLDAWRRTHEVVLATGTGGEIPLEPPATLRVAVSAIPRRSPRLLDPLGAAPSTLIPASGGRRPGWQLPALAAVIVVGLVLGIGALAVDQAGQANLARRQAAELAGLSTTVDRVLRDSDHTSIALVGPDGSSAGTAAWSSSDIMVMTTVLAPPGPGAEYRCWVERDGRRTPIGVMRFADGVAYWSGPLERYGDLPLDGGGRLGVSLEVPGRAGSGAPVLVGLLPS